MRLSAHLVIVVVVLTGVLGDCAAGQAVPRRKVYFEPPRTVSVDVGLAESSPEGLFGGWLRGALLRRFPALVSVSLFAESISRSDGRGVVRTILRGVELAGPAKELARAARWSQRLVESRAVDVVWTVRLFEGPADALGEGSPAMSVEALGRDTAEELSASLLSRGAVETHRAEFSGRACSDLRVLALQPATYLKSWRWVRLPSGDLAVPELGTLHEGLQGWMALGLLPGGKEMVVAADLGLGVLERPLARREIVLPDGRPRWVDLPAMSTTRWTVDELVLGVDETGFIVKGFPSPGRPEGKGARTRRWLLVDLEVIPPSPATVLGAVLGVDRGQGLAFVRGLGEQDCQPGQSVRFLREGRVVGRGEILEIVGRLVTVRVDGGRVRRGDTLR